MQLPQLQQLLQEKNNFPVIIAYSGGIDSRVLLDYIYNHTPNNLKSLIIILHYNHQWSSYSGELAKFCQEQAQKYYPECQFVLGVSSNQGQTSEKQARDYRYEYFKLIANKYNAQYLLMGHHLEDNIETFFLRLARGTGLKGLKAIPEKRNLTNICNIHRPLINTSKQELINYINSNNLEIYTDPSNTDINIKRNFLRQEVIPLFNKINNNFSHNINNLITTINTEEDYWQTEINKYKTNSQTVFKTYHPALQNRLLKELLESHNIKGVSHELITTLVNKLNTLESCKITLQTNIYFLIENNKFYIQIEIQDNTQKNNFPHSVFILDNNKQTINTITFTPKQINLTDIPKSKNPLYINLAEYINKKLVIRHREPGDYITPLGSNYKCKLQDFLINRKISEKTRNSLLVLAEENSQEVLIIFSIEINDKVKVTSTSSHVITF